MSDASKGMELARKLGIRKGMCIAIVNPPYGFVQSLIEIREQLRAMHTDIKMNEALDMDLIVYFSRGRKGLEDNMPKLLEDLQGDGMLWVGWLKPKSLRTDLDERAVREIGQKHGMTAMEGMSFSDDWPMLKFVRAKGGGH